MKAVVWTDFFQGFIMFGGLLVVLIVVSFTSNWGNIYSNNTDGVNTESPFNRLLAYLH